MSNAGLQPEAADPGDRSSPRRALPLVWLGFSLKDFAPPALTQGTALALSWEADHWMGAGHRHPKFCEARDTIVTMKPENDEEGAMGDVVCGQNAVHHSKGASVPMAPDTACPSHAGVLERTAALIERVSAEYLFLAVALPWGLALVFLVPPFRVFDEPMHYERAWSVADGQLLSAPDGTVRVPTNVAALFKVAMATKDLSL